MRTITGDRSIHAADQFYAVSPSNTKRIGVPPLLRTKLANVAATVAVAVSLLLFAVAVSLLQSASLLIKLLSPIPDAPAPTVTAGDRFSTVVAAIAATIDPAEHENYDKSIDRCCRSLAAGLLINAAD